MLETYWRLPKFTGNFLISPLLLSLLLMAINLVAMKVIAAEVDQFSNIDQPVLESSTLIETEVDRLIRLALQSANAARVDLKPKKFGRRYFKPAECNVERLYSALQGELARSVIGQLESYAEESPSVSKRVVPFDQSIYRDFLWPESPSLVLSKRMAAVIKLNGVEVGTDKLGHFFTEGHSYFEATSYLTEAVEHGLHFGQWTESLYFGAQTTGVFSYADLVANFNGLRFWNRILALQPDPLTQARVSPYIACEAQHWVVREEFKLASYVDGAWSEANNCSMLRSHVLLEKVQTYKPRCAVNELPTKKYGALSSQLLNDQGLAVMKAVLEPEVLMWEKARLNDIEAPQNLIERIKRVRLAWEEWRHGLTLE